MARRIVKIQIRQYQFTPPESFSESEFKYFKQLLKSDPNANLNEKVSPGFLKKSLRLTGKAIAGAFLLLNPPLLEQEVKSEINRLKAKKDEDEFYKILRDIVNASENYKEFHSILNQIMQNVNK